MAVRGGIQAENHPMQELDRSIRRTKYGNSFVPDSDIKILHSTKSQLNFLADLFKMPQWKITCIILELGYNHFWKEYQEEIRTAITRQRVTSEIVVNDEIKRAHGPNNDDLDLSRRLLREHIDKNI